IKIVNHHVHELFERAIRMENFKLFLALLRIPHVNVSTPQYCALRHAVYQGLVEYVSEVVRVPSADPNLKDRQGHTALMYAIKGQWSQKKALDMVRAILLTGKVNPNLRNPDKETALHFALRREWYDVGEALADAGSHPRIEDNNGDSPLSIATKALNCPHDLFSKMILFTGEIPPEEEEAPEDDAPDPDTTTDDQNDDAPAANTTASPGVSVSSAAPPPPKDDAQPTIRKVDTTVVDTVSNSNGHAQPEPEPVVAAAPEVHEDGNFPSIMGDQAVDETMEKAYLFQPAQDGDPRYRMHRKPVLEALDQLNEILDLTDNGINAEDARRVDPATGMTLWHAAAQHGLFREFLEKMADRGEWPDPGDLMARTESGKTVCILLDESSSLNATLNAALWQKHPRLLATLLSTLGEGRRRAFAGLITRANLMILHGG
ncbi:MAG: ankyrin repeat domain-containing protein, partial [Bacteroidota bacterium]